MEKIAEGLSAEIFKLKGESILKLYKTQHTFVGRHEAKAAPFINKLNLLSPKFRATVEVKGRLGLIYQRLDGINLFDLYKSASSNPAKIEKLGKLLADVHISLHKNKVPNFPPLINYLKKNSYVTCSIKQNEKTLFRGSQGPA